MSTHPVIRTLRHGFLSLLSGSLCLLFVVRALDSREGWWRQTKLGVLALILAFGCVYFLRRLLLERKTVRQLDASATRQ